MPVDLVAGFFASAVSTAAVYPLETSKVRSQSGRPFVWGEESPPTILITKFATPYSKDMTS